MNCTNCGNALRPGDQFCLKCGSPAPLSSPGQETPDSPPYPEDYKSSQQPQSHPQQATQAPPSQQPQAYPSSDAQSQVRTLYGLAMLVSLIGGIMLMVFDFGGWYNYDGYLGVREWGWVGPYVNTYSFFPFFAVACSLFYCSFIAYQGFSSKEPLPWSMVFRGLVISIIVLAVVGGGAVALFAMTAEADSTWLEAGFYGGAIGSLLTALMFGLVLKNTPHTKVDKRAGHGAQPYSSQSAAQYPYPQTQTPQTDSPQMIQPPEPSPQPPPDTPLEPQVTGAAEREEQKPPEKTQPEQEPQPTQEKYEQQPQQQQYQQSYYPQYQQQYQQPQQQTYPCRTCGRPLRYVPEYRRWYCDTCRQYV